MPVIIVPVRETAMVRQVDVHGIKAILKTAVLIYGGFLYLKDNCEIEFRGPGDIERDFKHIAHHIFVWQHHARGQLAHYDKIPESFKKLVRYIFAVANL